MLKLIKKILNVILHPNLILFKAYKFTDKLRGLDFLGVVHPSELGINPDIANRYSPSGNKYLKKVLVSMNITKEDSILDIGCGKGDAMRMMLRFPFRRVDGLELSPFLANIAKVNFTKLKCSRCHIYM